MLYKSKPVVIEAFRFLYEDSINEMEKLWGKEFREVARYVNRELFIATPEGVMTVSPGDWVIKGTIDEFYPCKDVVFQKKYELLKGEEK